VSESVLTVLAPVAQVVTDVTTQYLAVVSPSESSVLTVLSPVAQVVTDLTQVTDVITEILMESGPQGTVGPRGDVGPAGSRFTFNQLTPAAAWLVVHNLNAYPTVTVVIDGDEVITDVEYVDANTVYLSFPYPVAGSAYVY